MIERRNTVEWPIIVGVIFAVAVLGPPVFYVGGYFVVSKLNGPPGHDILVRDFNHRWQAEIYSPLLKVESLGRGHIEPAWAADP